MNENELLSLALALVRLAPSGRPFTDRLGRPAPYLIDSRGLVSNTPMRRIVVESLLRAICNQCDVVAGISKSGVPWAAMAADRLDLPLAVVLEEPRRSGLRRQIEGIVAGADVLVLDNFTSTGRSLLEGARVVTNAGGNVVGTLALVATPAALRTPSIRAVFPLAELLRVLSQAGRLTVDNYRMIMEQESLP